MEETIADRLFEILTSYGIRSAHRDARRALAERLSQQECEPDQLEAICAEVEARAEKGGVADAPAATAQVLTSGDWRATVDDLRAYREARAERRREREGADPGQMIRQENTDYYLKMRDRHLGVGGE